MKILAIRLENLASLAGNHELDFTQPPLADAGLFAITGPTGAGKSTLLDALCLALYGNTPRLRGARQDQARLPDVGDSDVTSFDPRTLLRRGAAGGCAEVDFLGRNGHRYRARWAVRRARDKAEGRLQTAEQSLTDLEDGRLLTAQKREFDRLLPEVLGLTFEQFTRAVLLAQSEFSAFLKADDNDRSDLLERLTGTSEYSAISMAAYRRAKEAKSVVDALLARLADDLPAPPEERAELERGAHDAERRLNAMQQEAQGLKARAQWHETDERLRRAYAEGHRQQQDAETHWQALAEARRDREWRHQLAPQRHRLARQAELPGEIADLEEAHARTRRAQVGANTTRRKAGEAREQAEQALQAATTARQQAEPGLRQARECAQAKAALEQQLTALDKENRDRQQQAEQLARQQQQAEEEWRRLEQKREAWQTTLNQLMGDHAGLEEARHAAQQQHDRAARRSLAVSELVSVWQTLCRAEQAHQALTRRLDDGERRQAQLLEQGKAARQCLDERDIHYRSLQTFIERNRAVRSESVLHLRQGLQEHEPCPVCGGLDHPWRHHPPQTPEAAQLAAQQNEEERQLTEAEALRDQAQQARDERLGEFRAVEAALVQLRHDLKEAERTLATSSQAVAQHPLQAELAAVEPAARDTWLTQQRQESDAERQRAERILKELARADAELTPLAEALRQAELQRTQLETRHASLEQELARLAERIPPLRQQRDALADQLQALLGEHESVDAWQQQLETQRDTARQTRDQAIERCHAAERERERLTQQVQHEAAQLDRLTQERDTLDDELREWRRAHPDLDDATLARLLAQSEAEASHQERQLADAEEARQRLDASLAERRQALIRHRREQALTDNASADDATLLGDAVDAELQRRAAALASEREALVPRLAEAQKMRDDAVHALRDDDRRRERQQAGQAELEAARAQHHRWGRISELIGSADGKAFRRIAQAYNLELLLDHANAHLTNLAPRYRLARGGSPLGMLVIDHDMGDEQRSAHSLSGGETFLVSLALALGLASMASGNLVIESLFIDEGFGSLDPQSLALAMDALDGLQAQGRKVGVISHIQEMHERIPVQIKVEPLGNGASRARLVSA